MGRARGEGGGEERGGAVVVRQRADGVRAGAEGNGVGALEPDEVVSVGVGCGGAVYGC